MNILQEHYKFTLKALTFSSQIFNWICVDIIEKATMKEIGWEKTSESEMNNKRKVKL